MFQRSAWNTPRMQNEKTNPNSRNSRRYHDLSAVLRTLSNPAKRESRMGAERVERAAHANEKTNPNCHNLRWSHDLSGGVSAGVSAGLSAVASAEAEAPHRGAKEGASGFIVCLTVEYRRYRNARAARGGNPAPWTIGREGNETHRRSSRVRRQVPAEDGGVLS